MSEKKFRHHIENEEVQVDYNFHPGCVVEMAVRITPKASAAAYHKAMKEIRKEVSIPGFRKGKLPEEILVKNFSQQIEANFEDVLRQISFTEATQLIKREPFSKYLREVKVKQKSHNDYSEIYFEFESVPQVPSIDLSAIQIKPVAPNEPTEKEISFFLLRLRFAWSEKKTQEDRPAEENDAVTLFLSALINGEERIIEAEKELLLSKDLFPEWLYQSVLGMKATDTKQLHHPEEKNEDGSPVLYTIKVTQVAACTLPPEDDSFAAKWHYESMEKFREAVRHMLRLQYKNIAQEKMRRQLRNELIRLYAFDLPQSLVEMETEGRYRAFLETAASAKETDRETERKPFLDSVKRYFTCLYLLHPLHECISKEVSREELVQELERQTHEVPFTQRIITQKLEQEELVHRLASSVYMRRTEDYCLQKILGSAILNEAQQKELRETELPVELHESIGVAPQSE